MTENTDSDDENTVVTTSKKNRIQSGGVGPDMPELTEVTVTVDIPIWMEAMEAQLTIQRAIMTMMEQVGDATATTNISQMRWSTSKERTTSLSVNRVSSRLTLQNGWT